MKLQSLMGLLAALILSGVSCAQGSAGEGVGGAGGSSGETTGQVGANASSTSASVAASSGAATTGASSSSSGGGCTDSPCKLTLPQCGCAAGEQCSIKTGARACVPEGNVAIGQVCGSGITCVPGALCVQTSPSVATCAEFCATDADCQAPGGLCVVGLNDGMGGKIPGVTMCTQNCDPITNSGCVAGTSCQVQHESMGLMRYLTTCTGAGSGTQGSLCPTNDVCAPGYGCTGQNAQQQTICLKWCKKAAPSCGPLETCTSFQTPAVIGGIEYGVCL